jgi:N6-adenosine-specific RNA methylase IME4
MMKGDWGMTRKGKEIILAPVLGTLAETAWTPPEQMTHEQWVECGRKIAQIHGASSWWLGDVWLYGLKRKYGDGKRLAAEIGVNYKTVCNVASVAKAFDSPARRENLSFSHHEAAAKIKNREQRGEWLDKAERQGWDRQQFRTELQRDRMTHRHLTLARLDPLKEKFSLVYADPPWKFETHSDLGKVMTSADNHYPPMTLKEICDLEIETSDGRKVHVSEIIADDAGMFMWATVPCLFYAPVAWRAWGFRADRLPRNPNFPTELEQAQEFAGGYSSQGAWDKIVPGMGYGFRNQHEILFYVRRGEPPKPIKTFPSMFRFRKGKHSAKPPQIRKYIEEMYPMLGQRNRIELFARGKVPGWTVWGNEAVPSTLSPDSNVAQSDPGPDGKEQLRLPGVVRSNVAPVDLRSAAVKMLTDELSERHPFVPNRPQRAIKGGGENEC